MANEVGDQANADDLAEFLSARHPRVRETALWGNGTLPLEFHTYLSQALPPVRYVSSVRALVFRGDEILVSCNENDLHIVPGGRLEAGESIEQALHREVREETGWTISELRMVGFIHFHHLAAKPAGYAYPHPDFLQLVYRAETLAHDPSAMLVDEYEWCGFRLCAISEIPALPLPAGQRVLFDEALRMHNS